MGRLALAGLVLAWLVPGEVRAFDLRLAAEHSISNARRTESGTRGGVSRWVEVGRVRIGSHAEDDTSADPAGWEGRLTPLETKLFADAADGRFDSHTLLAAALIAGGCDDTEALQGYVASFDKAAAELRAELERSNALEATPHRRAQLVLEFLHRRILTGGYDLASSDLRAALDEGRFNCVSASVLFNCLARHAGLAVCGLEMPGHAMSRVLLSDDVIDIETTCPKWFRLAGDPKQQAEHLEATLGEGAPRDRSRVRPITDLELTAMIYYNRGVDLLAENRFALAAAANAKALRLDPNSTTALGNLLATVNNWAIALGATGQYADAADLLRRGIEMDPAYETFHLNAAHVYHQWMLSLCREGRYEDALRLLDGAAARFPQVAYLRVAPEEVYRIWAEQVSRHP